MCGICGAFSYSLDKGEMEVVEQLMICNSVRGMDSSGAFNVIESLKKNTVAYNVTYGKTTTAPSDFITRYRRSMFNPDVKPKSNVVALVCHNRLATVGEIKEENAHPFFFEHIAGVHNGTIQHTWGADAPKFGTDSEALYYQLNKRPVKEVIEEMGRGWGNAYALAFWDKRDRTLNLLRNNDRPLSYAIVNRTVYFASEGMMLEWILKRNRMNVSVISLPAYIQHKFDLTAADPARALDKIDVTPPTPTYTYNYGNYGWAAEEGDRKRAQTVAPPTCYGKVRVLMGEKGDPEYWEQVSWLEPQKASYVVLIPTEAAIKARAEAAKDTTTASTSVTTIDDHNQKVLLSGGTVPKKLPEPPQGSLLAYCQSQYFGSRHTLDDDIPDFTDCTDCTVGKDDRASGTEGVEDYYLDKESNVVSAREFERIMLDGCAGCGFMPDLDEIMLEDDLVDGIFKKDDTGSVRFTCSDYERGMCRCYNPKVLHTKLN